MNITQDQIEVFLNKVDKTFPVSLSEKQDLHEFAHKLSAKATICAKTENGEMLSAVFGYTENVMNNMAYISIVATLPEGRGKGLASQLVREFIEIAKRKGLDGVHLYAVSSNVGAMSMYRHLGFEDLVLADEPRPDDAHLVYYIRK